MKKEEKNRKEFRLKKINLKANFTQFPNYILTTPNLEHNEKILRTQTVFDPNKISTREN
jgi:hypothetical protein